MTNQYAISEVKLTYKTKVKANERAKIKCSQDIYTLLINSVFDPETIEYRETLKMILLNRSNQVIGVHQVSEGGISGTVVDIRIIMQCALLTNCTGIILAHNHPSGNLQTSKEDDNLTVKVTNACKLLDIHLLDHLIVTPEGYFSYADEGRI